MSSNWVIAGVSVPSNKIYIYIYKIYAGPGPSLLSLVDVFITS